MNCGFFATWFY